MMFVILMEKISRFGLMATKVVLDPDKDYGDLRIIDLYDPNTLKVDYKDFERNLASNEKGMEILKELRCH